MKVTKSARINILIIKFDGKKFDFLQKVLKMVFRKVVSQFGIPQIPNMAHDFSPKKPQNSTNF